MPTLSHGSLFEALESRQMLSGLRLGEPPAKVVGTVPFSALSADVQAGLASLATHAGLTAPASDSTTPVALGNPEGVPTYTLSLRGAGVKARFTVDVHGDAWSPPTVTSTTWADLAGPSGDAEASAEILVVASALGLNTPADGARVRVVTDQAGDSVYSIMLLGTPAGRRTPRLVLSVDGDGNPVGEANLPFSVFSSAIQDGLNALAPSGSTPLDASSTQTVRVRTRFGQTTYATNFTSAGVVSTSLVDVGGAAAALPSISTSTFGALSGAAQAGLQSLAGVLGFVGSIDPAASVRVLDQANGQFRYSVALPFTRTLGSGKTVTYRLLLTVDDLGNAALPVDSFRR